MPEAIHQFVELIHRAPGRVVLVVSGGGSGAIGSLLTVPGASRTVLEVEVPYCQRAMVDYLGGRPDQFCSIATSRALAVRALHRAHDQAESDDAAVAGIACTAGLKTDRPRRGGHRAHVAMQTDERTVSYSLTLVKDRRDRHAEEQIVERMILNTVAEASGLAERLGLGLDRDEPVERAETIAPPAWQDVLLGRRDVACVRGHDEQAHAVFSGAFNPMHIGHRRMTALAREILGERVHFEISLVNVDKPPMDYAEIEGRLAQFDPDQPVWLSRAATFEEKSQLFPGATFVVGIDTLRRIADPRYYGQDDEARNDAIERIASRGCQFLVFGRDMGTGFMRLGDLDLPETLAKICREVPSDHFREDISSTELRRRG